MAASLVTAQLAANGAIHLHVADSGRPQTTLLVHLPGTGGGTLGGHPALHDRSLASRRAFIESIVSPPFEAAALLYGTAGLTLVAGDR